jgi:flagellar FliJ protein
MPSTRFSLQRVLEYRQGVVDRLQLELGALQADQARATEHLATLRTAERVTLDELGELQRGVLDMAQVTRLTDELDVLLGWIAGQAAVVQELEEQATALRTRVLAAAQDVKALEKLRDRKGDEHTQELRRLERIETSEIAALQHRRQMVAL